MSKEVQIKLNKDKKGGFNGDFALIVDEVRAGNNIVGLDFNANGILFKFSKKPKIVSEILEAIEKQPEPEVHEQVMKKPSETTGSGIKVERDGLTGEIYNVFLPDMAMDFIKNTVIPMSKKKSLQYTLDLAAQVGIKEIGHQAIKRLEEAGAVDVDKLIKDIEEIDVNDPNLDPEIKKMVMEAQEAGKEIKIKRLKIDDDDDPISGFVNYLAYD